MKTTSTSLTLIFCLQFLAVSAKTIYVTPAGKSTNTGTAFTSAYNLTTALTAVAAGDTILMQSGSYSIPYVAGQANTIFITKSGTEQKRIYMLSSTSAKAEINFSFPPHLWVQNSFGFDITGSYWYFKGISFTNAGYHGVYNKGAHNSFVNCSFSYNKFSGLEINKGGSYTTIINCDAYRNYDPKNMGGSADGFAPKQTMGVGNVLMGCRAYENSDDGYDTYDCPNPVIFENCWAFNNGELKIENTTYAGNQNGFKLGGLEQIQNNKVYNCVSFGHKKRGYDENNNNGGIQIYNCLAYNNAVNYYFSGTIASGQKHDFKNNISLSETSPSLLGGSNTQSNNSWNNGVSVSVNDFKSLNLALASQPRNEDGSLPQTDLFRLASGSDLIDAGIKIAGRPYNGTAPDIGPFESPGVTTSLNTQINFANNIVLFPSIVDQEVNIRILASLNEASVSIFSMDGTVIYNGDISANESVISCQGFKPGKYIVKVKNEGIVSGFSFVKR